MSRPLVSARTHVVSLVAVFLALAIGIALGGGPLGGAAGSDTSAGDEESPAADTPSPAAAVDPAYADDFAANGAARLYADGLSGHAAAILALPGADAAQVKSLTAQVLAAGGALTGTYTLDAEALDPEAESDLDAATGELATSLGDPRVDPSVEVHERTGRLLALAMATDQQSSTRADASATTIRSAFADSGLLASPVDVRLAPLVLVVLPPGATSAVAGRCADRSGERAGRLRHGRRRGRGRGLGGGRRARRPAGRAAGRRGRDGRRARERDRSGEHGAGHDLGGRGSRWGVR